MHQKATGVGSAEPNGRGAQATAAKRTTDESLFFGVVCALVTLQPAYQIKQIENVAVFRQALTRLDFD